MFIDKLIIKNEVPKYPGIPIMGNPKYAGKEVDGAFQIDGYRVEETLQFDENGIMTYLDDGMNQDSIYQTVSVDDNGFITVKLTKEHYKWYAVQTTKVYSPIGNILREDTTTELEDGTTCKDREVVYYYNEDNRLETKIEKQFTCHNKGKKFITKYEYDYNGLESSRVIKMYAFNKKGELWLRTNTLIVSNKTTDSCYRMQIDGRPAWASLVKKAGNEFTYYWGGPNKNYSDREPILSYDKEGNCVKYLADGDSPADTPTNMTAEYSGNKITVKIKARKDKESYGDLDIEYEHWYI